MDLALRAGQDGGHMLIGREGILGQGSGPFIGLPALAKRKEDAQNTPASSS